MKRLLVALLPFAVACSSSSTKSPATTGDASTNPSSADGGTTGGGDASNDTGHDAGSGTGGDAGATPTPPDAGAAGEAACTAWASAFCTQLSTCSAFALAAGYGSVATCEARIFLTCTATLAASGNSATPSSTSTCATSMSATSCTNFLAGDLGTGCTAVPGTVPSSGACAFSGQCATNFCAISGNSVCGTCQPPTTVGGPCSSGACATGQFCDTKTSECVAGNSVASGGSCDIVEQCDLAAGVACNPIDGKCDLAVTVSPDGGSCGATIGLSSSAVVCPASGACSSDLAPGTCSVAAADEGACTTDGGVNCLTPAACVNGTCTLPNAASCK